LAKARVYAKLDKQGISELMKSSDLGKVLEEQAKRIDRAAGGGYEIQVAYERRKSRVISMVLDNTKKEYATGALARAVGSIEEPWKK
jgi:hypothetical protein